MEIWKDIEGYEGLYQVSNRGRVKSLSRKVKNKNGYRVKKESILKPKPNGKGYHIVGLYIKGISKNFTIHYLVLSSFIPNTFNKRTINHIDSNRTNNRLDNLEWATHKENTKHGFVFGNMDMNDYIRIGKLKSKKVIMLSMDNKPLLKFDSQTEAQIISEFDSRRISDCCCNKIESYKGYKWQFA